MKTFSDNETHVRNLIERWAQAISAKNRAGILAHHAQDLLMFDFPSVERGIEAYDRSWDFFYANSRAPISFLPDEVNVTAGEDVAFASCLIHCEGSSAGPVDLRLTVGLRKIEGAWTIVHEHHSVPTLEDRFIDPERPVLAAAAS